jgi:hypothetical protein
MVRSTVLFVAEGMVNVPTSSSWIFDHLKAATGVTEEDVREATPELWFPFAYDVMAGCWNPHD